MELNVKVKVYDLIENTERLLADGKAILLDNKLSYMEKESPVRNDVSFSNDKVTIKRVAEVESFTELYSYRIGKAQVKSEYGDMEFETELLSLQKDEDIWSVQYKIMAGKEVASHVKVVWEFSGLKDNANIS